VLTAVTRGLAELRCRLLPLRGISVTIGGGGSFDCVSFGCGRWFLRKFLTKMYRLPPTSYRWMKPPPSWECFRGWARSSSMAPTLTPCLISSWS
jgi:hypothetical protein